MAPYWSDYSYDLLGNRTQLVEHATGGATATSATTTYTHPASGAGAVGPHRVTGVSKTTAGTTTTSAYSYDAAGNRDSVTTAGATVDYLWDAEGELAGVDGELNTYDASGSRLVRTGASGTTVYLPGGQEITIGASSVSATRYYSFAGQTVAMRTGNGMAAVSSLVSDQHGSVVAAVPNTGVPLATAVQRMFSDPFGAARAGSSAMPGDHRFLGAVRDAGSGLTLLAARYYDEVLGQFVSVDPLLDSGTPAQFNAYSYGFNNPVTFSDPSGLVPSAPGGPRPKSGGATTTAATASTPPPPSTSWAALQQCKDFWCGATWWATNGAQSNLAQLQGIGELVLMVTPIPAFQEFQAAVSDWNGYTKDKEAQRDLAWGVLTGGPDAWGDAFVDPYVHQWENAPGAAFGSTALDAATLLIPVGGAAIKGLRGLKALQKTTTVNGVNATGQLTSRSSFRAGTLDDAWNNADVGPNGGRLCSSSCGTEVTAPPNSGVPRDWDASHNPSWSNREFPSTSSRSTVLDNYNEGVSVECPACNRSGGNNDSRFVVG